MNKHFFYYTSAALINLLFRPFILSIAVAKLHAYAVLHVCECKDKALQSKNKRFQFLWQYVAGVCRLLKGTERSVYKTLCPKIGWSLWNIVSYDNLAWRATQNETFTWVYFWFNSVASWLAFEGGRIEWGLQTAYMRMMGLVHGWQSLPLIFALLWLFKMQNYSI